MIPFSIEFEEEFQALKEAGDEDGKVAANSRTWLQVL